MHCADHSVERRPLRILLVTSDKFPPFRPAARLLFGRELAARGHVVDWLVQAERESDYPADAPGADGAHDYAGGRAWIAHTDDGHSRLRRLRKYWLDFRNDLRLFGCVRRGGYDVVQVKDKYLAALLAVIACRRHRVPLSYWLAYPHGEASLYEARHGIARYRGFYFVRGLFMRLVLYRIVLPASRLVFVQSEQMRDDIAAEGIPAAKMTPVPGALDPEEIPWTPSPPASGKRIVYLGTLIRTRRLDFLVRVYARVRERHPDAALVFVGRGEMPEDEALLRAEADRLGVSDGVHFTGHLPMREAWAYVRDCAVGVSPYFPSFTLNSTSPTKLIEYMAMGRPVVANDHPEQRRVIEQSGAGHCVAWDEDAFADAICSVLDDPTAAAEMGTRGREWVLAHRTNALMAERIEHDYHRLVCAS